ncbi:CDP-glucose 4,6-dehydratase [bacterium]|jgi:CDP-glucose 4,6-dehydratase|nr:CDP-glucose 4,6-dehydratase [bacterium]
MEKNFWKNKSVLVTGHTGFKGSWLVLLLSKLGAKISGVSNSVPTVPSMFEEVRVGKHLEYDHRIDITSPKLADVFTKSFDVVFHLAAQPMVKESYSAPMETFRVNTLGTVNLLEGVLRAQSPPSATVIITTDKVYASNEECLGYRESDKLGGHDPYSASKAAAELVVNSYRDSFFHKLGLGLASARAGNVIGPGDYGKFRLIPDILRSRRNGKELVIRFPSATRPWQHVLDPLMGYLMLAQMLHVDYYKYSTAFNFGPIANGKCVAEIVEHFKSTIGGFTEVYKSSSQHETGTLKLDSSKSMEYLGWRPHISEDECFDSIINYETAENKSYYVNSFLDEHLDGKY